MKCHACTVYKDTLNGTPGIRATVDPTTVEEATAKQKEHLEVSLFSSDSIVLITTVFHRTQ